MLYAAGVPDRKAMKNSPHIGIASVWFEGNPCKKVEAFLFDTAMANNLPVHTVLPYLSDFFLIMCGHELT
jgi:hypothetical protein